MPQRVGAPATGRECGGGNKPPHLGVPETFRKRWSLRPTLAHRQACFHSYPEQTIPSKAGEGRGITWELKLTELVSLLRDLAMTGKNICGPDAVNPTGRVQCIGNTQQRNGRWKENYYMKWREMGIFLWLCYFLFYFLSLKYNIGH